MSRSVPELLRQVASLLTDVCEHPDANAFPDALTIPPSVNLGELEELSCAFHAYADAVEAALAAARAGSVPPGWTKVES